MNNAINSAIFFRNFELLLLNFFPSLYWNVFAQNFGFYFTANQSTFFYLIPPSLEKLGKGLHGSYFLDGWLYFALGRDQTPDAKRNAGAFRVKYVLAEPSRVKNSAKAGTNGKTPSKVDLSVGDAKETKETKEKDGLDDPMLLHQVTLFWTKYNIILVKYRCWSTLKFIVHVFWIHCRLNNNSSIN